MSTGQKFTSERVKLPRDFSDSRPTLEALNNEWDLQEERCSPAPSNSRSTVCEWSSPGEFFNWLL